MERGEGCVTVTGYNGVVIIMNGYWLEGKLSIGEVTYPQIHPPSSHTPRPVLLIISCCSLTTLQPTLINPHQLPLQHQRSARPSSTPFTVSIS